MDINTGFQWAIPFQGKGQGKGGDDNQRARFRGDEEAVTARRAKAGGKAQGLFRNRGIAEDAVIAFQAIGGIFPAVMFPKMYRQFLQALYRFPVIVSLGKGGDRQGAGKRRGSAFGRKRQGLVTIGQGGRKEGGRALTVICGRPGRFKGRQEPNPYKTCL
jgi:hypothetical protein